MMPADFHYELPAELIAQAPLPARTTSRLLEVRPDGSVGDLHMADLPGLLRAGDLLVLNDTRVLPARLFGRKASGGRVEMLLERLLGPDVALAQLRSSHAPRPGTVIEFDGAVTALVEQRRDEFFVLRFPEPVAGLLERCGHVPLPPYIRRPDEPADRDRYQTVYARVAGSVAAPTAGLHFDAGLLDVLRERGVGIGTVTLHVGAGTFAPLRPHQLKTGRLHSEEFEVSAQLCQSVTACRQRGGRVVAVGTTTTRALETAGISGTVAPMRGETDIFLRPGCRFRVVDALLTNFHLPESSLLMLVCAFAGTGRVMSAYRHAVARSYRFYSYGGAMFVARETPEGAA